MAIASRRRAVGALLSGAAAALVPGTRSGQAAARSISPELWIWCGAVTSRSAIVKARFNGEAGDARLTLSAVGATPGTPVSASARAPLPGGGQVLTFSLEDLQPGYDYFYSVDRGEQPGGMGRFRTWSEGPHAFTVAFASCASTGSNSRIFETIERRSPALMIHMGDFHYRNIKENRPDKFVEAFDEVLTAPRQASLYRHVPIAYMWDDHDYGDDDSDGTCRSRPAARAMYEACVPHYPFAAPGLDSTIQQSFTIGRVQFVMTDNRSARTPVTQPDSLEKSMLGIAQRDWFAEELRRAAGSVPLVVWVNSVPWITKASTNQVHGWQPWSAERRWLADVIKRLNLERRLVVLSGDGHMVAMDDGRNSNYASDAAPGSPAFVVAHAAPLDRYPRRKGGPYSHGMSAKRNQFGLFSVEDDGQFMRVEITGHVRDGTMLPGMRLRLRMGPDGYTVE